MKVVLWRNSKGKKRESRGFIPWMYNEILKINQKKIPHINEGA